MTYTVAAVLGVLAALLVDLVMLGTRLVLRVTFWVTYPIVLGFQLVGNGVLSARGVVHYAGWAILGPRFGYAPVEDLAFGFALVLSSLSVWVWRGRRGVPATPPASRPRWPERLKRRAWPERLKRRAWPERLKRRAWSLRRRGR